jgi:hypothetical protein
MAFLTATETNIGRWWRGSREFGSEIFPNRAELSPNVNINK